MSLALANRPSNDLMVLLERGGVPTPLQPLAIQYMNMLPLTVEPESQGTILLVQGLQRLLRARGARLAVDGGLGAETVAALRRYAGPRWDQKSWATLYQDVLRGPWRGPIRNDRELLDAAAPAAQGDLYAPMGATEAELIARRDELLRQRLARQAYCTTTNVQPGCTPIAGVAKPMTTAALAAFKDLQAQLNRLLQHFAQAPVAVDGRIGAGVMRGLDVVRDKIAFARVVLPKLSLDQTAETAQAGGAVLKLLADGAGAAAVAPAAPSIPSIPQLGGGVRHPPDPEVVKAAGLGPAGTSPWLLLAAGGVAVLLLAKMPAQKPRRRRRSR